VEVVEHPDEVHLTVGDAGSGFDVQAAKRGSGIGLTSMHERVRLVNGEIRVESKPMQGTTIQVRVPLKPAEWAAQRTAGSGS
jgi:signal transduction histidine kinase